MYSHNQTIREGGMVILSPDNLRYTVITNDSSPGLAILILMVNFGCGLIITSLRLISFQLQYSHVLLPVSSIQVAHSRAVHEFCSSPVLHEPY